MVLFKKIIFTPHVLAMLMLKVLCVVLATGGVMKQCFDEQATILFIAGALLAKAKGCMYIYTHKHIGDSIHAPTTCWGGWC